MVDEDLPGSPSGERRVGEGSSLNDDDDLPGSPSGEHNAGEGSSLNTGDDDLPGDSDGEFNSGESSPVDDDDDDDDGGGLPDKNAAAGRDDDDDDDDDRGTAGSNQPKEDDDELARAGKLGPDEELIFGPDGEAILESAPESQGLETSDDPSVRSTAQELEERALEQAPSLTEDQIRIVQKSDGTLTTQPTEKFEQSAEQSVADALGLSASGVQAGVSRDFSSDIDLTDEGRKNLRESAASQSEGLDPSDFETELEDTEDGTQIETELSDQGQRQVEEEIAAGLSDLGIEPKGVDVNESGQLTEQSQTLLESQIAEEKQVFVDRIDVTAGGGVEITEGEGPPASELVPGESSDGSILSEPVAPVAGNTNAKVTAKGREGNPLVDSSQAIARPDGEEEFGDIPRVYGVKFDDELRRIGAAVEQGIVDPTAAAVAASVFAPGDAAAELAGSEELREDLEAGEDLTQKGLESALGMFNAPKTGASLIELGEFIGKGAAEGVQGDGGEYLNKAGDAAEKALDQAVESGKENPLETGAVLAGSLIGTAGGIGAASKISQSAGRGVAAVVQPGEEIATLAANRALKGTRLGDALLDNKIFKGRLDNEEPAIRAAKILGQKAASTGKKAAGRAGGRFKNIEGLSSQGLPGDVNLADLEFDFDGSTTTQSALNEIDDTLEQAGLGDIIPSQKARLSKSELDSRITTPDEARSENPFAPSNLRGDDDGLDIDLDVDGDGKFEPQSDDRAAVDAIDMDRGPPDSVLEQFKAARERFEDTQRPESQSQSQTPTDNTPDITRAVDEFESGQADVDDVVTRVEDALRSGADESDIRSQLDDLDPRRRDGPRRGDGDRRQPEPEARIEDLRNEIDSTLDNFGGSGSPFETGGGPSTRESDLDADDVFRSTGSDGNLFDGAREGDGSLNPGNSQPSRNIDDVFADVRSGQADVDDAVSQIEDALQAGADASEIRSQLNDLEIRRRDRPRGGRGRGRSDPDPRLGEFRERVESALATVRPGSGDPSSATLTGQLSDSLPSRDSGFLGDERAQLEMAPRETEAESSADPRAETGGQTPSESLGLETETETETNLRPDAESRLDPETSSPFQTETELGLETETRLKTETESNLRSEAESRLETETESNLRTEAETPLRSEVAGLGQQQSQPVPQTTPIDETGLDTRIEPVTDLQTELGLETEIAQEMGLNVETETETRTETELETRTEAETELELEIETEQEQEGERVLFEGLDGDGDEEQLGFGTTSDRFDSGIANAREALGFDQ